MGWGLFVVALAGVDDIEGYIRLPCWGPKGEPCIGKFRAGNATKVMALADSAGLPLAVSIADVRDTMSLVDQTLDEAITELPPKLIVDNAFDWAGGLRTSRGWKKM
jgi:hypothetical protein